MRRSKLRLKRRSAKPRSRHEQAVGAEKDTFISALNADQLELAHEDQDIALAGTQDRIDAVQDRIDRRDKDKKPRTLPARLPRVARVIEPDSILCPCGCGDMVRIGEDRSARRDDNPARYQVIVTIRPESGSPIVDEALLRIAAICRVEADIRGLPPDDRRAVRQERSRPLPDAFFAWLTAQAGRVSRKSDPGKALASMIRRQEGFRLFPENGHRARDIDALMPWAPAPGSQDVSSSVTP